MIRLRRRTLRFFALALLSAGITALSFGVMKQVVLAQQTAGWVPFTATSIETQYDNAGRTAGFEEAVLAVRRDGSTVRSRKITTPAGQLVEQRSVRDLTRGMEIAVEGMTESLTRMPIDPQAVERFRLRPVRCTNEASPAAGAILGYDVVRDVRHLPGPAGTFRRLEEWRAPALDCFPLRQTLFKGNSRATLVLVNDRNITSVTLGEPSEELFEIPAGYAERAPSEVHREASRRHPQVGQQPCPTCTDALAAIEEKDRIYHAKRSAGTAQQ